MHSQLEGLTFIVARQLRKLL